MARAALRAGARPPLCLVAVALVAVPWVPVALLPSAAGALGPGQALAAQDRPGLAQGAPAGGPQGGVKAGKSAGWPTPQHPCGTRPGRPVVDKVLVIWEENHSFGSVIGQPAAPELNQLASRCGLATNYYANTHPSLPNYLEMTSGRPFIGWPWASDCDPSGSCTVPGPSVFSELVQAHQQWRSYVEAMGHNCGLASYGAYAAKHNPAAYFVEARRQCQLWDQPLGTLTQGPLHQALRTGPAAALTTVTPDVLDDMHNGTVARADRWLAAWVPQVLASPAYRSGQLAVLIAWDEGSGGGNFPSHAPLVVMSASTPAGARSALGFNDFSVTRAICELTGVPALGEAARAPSLVAAFHL